MEKIIVVGSISTDFVVNTDRRPEIGETVEGKGFTTAFGGKGANQAVVTARLGKETHMVGAVGDDEFAKRLLENLKENLVSVNNVERVTHCPSGSAIITLTNGDNSIIYVPGANAKVTTKEIDKADALIQESEIVLVQNETPRRTVEYLIDKCKQWDIPILLNPAPARELSQEYIESVTYLTPNETEFTRLFPNQSKKEVLEKYPNKLIITLGEKGVLYHNGEKLVMVPSFKVAQVVDTTGAGDTFNGAFAVAKTSGLTMEESIKFANLAAALSIQKHGAQTGAPTLEELKGMTEYEKEWDIK